MFPLVRRFIRLTAAPAFVAVLLVAASACGGYNPLKPSDFGIESTDLVSGNGTQLRAGRGATVNYTLWLYDETKPEGKGTQVESGTNFSFPFGYGRVISGWDIGLDGMKVGGTRRLVVPPEHAYGSQSSEKIPANSTLLFEVSLIGVY
jgi:FKBP-type peptidyl-prolyl cis-trans isomerase FkpA